MFTVSKEFHFEAAHSLPHLPTEHKCHHLHGHSYRFKVSVRGPLYERNAWVIDYADISDVVNPIVAMLDHKNLNEVLPCKTTAENLAFWLYQWIKPHINELYSIEVFETATTSVIYQP